MRIDDQLFPFRIRFDHEMVITEIGASLQKIAGSCQVGCSIRDLVLPAGGEWPETVDEIRKLGECSFDLTVNETQVVLRCQLTKVDDEFLVLGSPRRLRSLDELQELGLEIEDFALHDAAVDLLMLRDAQQATIEEHRDALLDVRDSDGSNCAGEQSKASLVHTLSMLGDLLLRLDDSGIILEAVASRTELLPNAPNALQGKSLRECH